MYSPLAYTDAALADRLCGRLVDRFLLDAGLSRSRRDEALAQVAIEHGRTPRGVDILRMSFPLGAGRSEYEWDGTADEAEQIVESAAVVAADGVVADRSAVGPTGWEPEFDEG
jgi:hypothetical protein